jgi:peptide/nickel transport system substrate-binding protein
MTLRLRRTAAALTLGSCALLAVACGRSASADSSGSYVVSPTGLVTTTAAGTKPVSSVTWAVYPPLNSLDPIFALDYSENTAISLMCESLLLQAPDSSIRPGLATVSTPSPTTMIFTLRPGVDFWDGDPVTPADVVYSLDRQMNPDLGGFYRSVFNRVSSIAATGAHQVTITLNQPDYWLEGELASMPGIVIQKSYAERQGANYGTPAGGIMCTGPYVFKAWSAGSSVTAAANPHYWNRAIKPKVGEIILQDVPDAASLSSGILTGAIQGSYYFGLPNLRQLEKSGRVRVYLGPGQLTDAFIISATSGPLASVKVRQALSLALDRRAIIDEVYDGAALMPRWIANPGTFGYGRSVFAAAYAKSPELTQNLAKARKLVQEAGATGQTITIGTSAQIATVSAVTAAYQQAAAAIGLKAVLKSVSLADYNSFFISASARKGVDGFPTEDYGDYADPAALLAAIVVPGGSQNYDNFSNSQITALLSRAEGSASPDQRAQLVSRAEELAAALLPWIPDVQPTSVLILSKGLTGATASFSYMFAPWADNLGGT